MREPKQSERKLLHEWIQRPSLGGACGFIGRDLAGFEYPSLYDEVHQRDLFILSDNHGEDDLFTKFVTGPLLSLYHWLRQYTRVSIPISVF
jgi:hypothetical protein